MIALRNLYVLKTPAPVICEIARGAFFDPKKCEAFSHSAASGHTTHAKFAYPVNMAALRRIFSALGRIVGHQPSPPSSPYSAGL